MPKRALVKYEALLQECSLANFADSLFLVMSEILKKCIQDSLWAEKKNLKNPFLLIAWLWYLTVSFFLLFFSFV